MTLMVACLCAQAPAEAQTTSPIGSSLSIQAAPAGDTLGAPRGGASQQAGVITVADLRREPDRYTGALVRWRVQNLGIQLADSLRSDMLPGEHYLLVRDPGGEAGYAYLIVPPELLPDARSIPALERVEVVARIRLGRSPWTGHPILDLQELH